MERIRIVLLIIFFIFTACNGGGSVKNNQEPPVSGRIYQGYVDGCKAHWDELICGKRTINADKQPIKRDSNGTPIVIDKEK